MAKVFSRESKDAFSSKKSNPPQTVTVEQLQCQEFQELAPPKEASSPSRSSTSSSTPTPADLPDDFGLSCTGLLGEEVMLDTDFGKMTRNVLVAAAESLRKLSEKMTEPISKKSKATQEENPVVGGEEKLVVVGDLGTILKENEKLKRENTWLQEENASLRGGIHDEEDDVRSQRTGKSV